MTNASFSQDTRFKQHDGIKERKLLWHGTNVAVVAAILSSGLRIMPHSGGRVGCGIYFASVQSKSAGYGKPCFYILLTNPNKSNETIRDVPKKLRNFERAS